MRYRTKIYLGLLFTAAVSSTLGIGILYQETSRLLKFELRTKVVSVAATASALINAQLVKEVAESLDKNSAPYLQLQRQLLEVRDNNRRPDLFVKYVYVLIPSKTDPKQMIFLGEAQNAVLPGDIDTQQSQSHIQDHLEEFYSPFKFIKDKWGIWMSGFSPIVDANGNYVATLGVDISGASAEAELRTILQYGLYALLGSLALAFFMARILSRRATESLHKLYNYVESIGEGDLTHDVELTSNDEFSELGKSIHAMAKGLYEREKLKNSLSKYVSKFVLDKALSQEEIVHLEGERKKITVLFSDIRHFTHLSEKLPPEEVVGLLNEYFDLMLDIAMSNHGTLDKFIGDGVMVEFGAPLADSEQEFHAVKAALEMQRELKKLCDGWEKEGKPRFDVGIGIHTGYAIVGNIGSSRRMEYTAIGDTVNVASRLEQATKTYKEKILISEETFSALSGMFPYRLIGKIQLPGRTQEITAYAILTSDENKDEA